MSHFRRFSMAGAALLASSAVSAQVQPASTQAASPATTGATGAAQPSTAVDEDEDIVVTGKPPRGSVIGDIPPQIVLSSRDVKATGATSFDELLDAIAPDIGIARGSGGGRPLVLLNGHRVSSYRELRDIPIEAVTRVDILPDEVALKYGYPPDQKVVNVVLQNRFAETVAQGAANTASHDGYTGGGADLTRIVLSPKQRTTLNLHAGTDDILRGAQRSLVEQQYESVGTGATGLLLPPELGVRGTATIDRELPGDIEGALNLQAAHSNGHLLSGLSEQLPAELHRHTVDDSFHLGSTLNGDSSQWHWSLAANGDLDHNRTITTRDGQMFAPSNAESLHAAGDLDATLNGPLFPMPAGAADVTIRSAASAEYLGVEQPKFIAAPPGSSHRETATAAASIDIPVSHRGRALGVLGNLTVNGNAEVDETSDFGALTRFGAGANWSPLFGLNLIGSWNREERAPSVRQLGDPFVETPGTRMFDFANGVVNRVAVVTGGNPNLRTDTSDIIDLSAEWQPFDSVNFRLRGDYAHVTIERPISNITVFPEIERAFPVRFNRDSAGNLVGVDLRPVNFSSAHRDTLLLGFDFTKPLKSHRVTNSEVERAVERARAAGISVPQSAGSGNAAPGSLANAATNGRLTFSLTDTITLVDRALIRADLPQLDYLHGAPIGQTGGQPRHQIQAQAGWSNNGMGARIGANWRSATEVDTLSGPLRFSPVATFDLRLFANVGQYLPIVSRHPWLRGVSARFEVGNIFNARPRVHNGAGVVPAGYEPSILDPLGRTIMITLRKQFLPASFYEEQLQKFQKQQSQQP